MPAPVASTPVVFGRLPTVLVPGLLCTPQLFMAQLPLFWTQGSVTVADTTRHGEIGAMARAILADAPPVFRLVGLSMGGYLAFEILRQAPERVGELVLFAFGRTPVDVTFAGDAAAITGVRESSRGL